MMTGPVLLNGWMDGWVSEELFFLGGIQKG